jgi:dTDP-4-dehydrorhamnose reductase
MRILITGANGQLGVALSQALAGRAEVVGCDLPAFDITAADCAAQVAAAAPDWVVHAAAATDVDGCEKNPAMAAAVNADGTRRIAEGCRRAGAGLVYISTDFVFDGGQAIPYVETDAPRPLSAYGRSKLAGEQAVREVAPRWAIARTAWLYGVHGRNFVKTIVTKAAAGESLRVVDDQVGSPTYAGDLARALAQLMAEGLTGVFHLTNAGSCSWYEFTQEILRQAGFGATPLAPMTSHDLNRPAARPAYSVLANTAWRTAGHPPLRPWPDALGVMLEAWRAAGASAEPVFPQPSR